MTGMIVSEEEARQRWCPFARALGQAVSNEDNPIPYTTNRKDDGEPDDWCLCIASRCMAWRFTDPPYGYCGLAGKP